MEFDSSTLAIVGLTFLLAGTVKGVIGLGLPTVSLALLAILFDLTSAMTLLLVPSLVTNIWQALIGGNFVTLSRRLWPMLLAATLAIWIGSLALTRIELPWLSVLLGFLLVVYASLSLVGFRLNLQRRQEPWNGPLFGTINGVLTGMTGSFVVPGVIYLQAIGLSRDMLVQAMGMLFSLSTLGLAVALQGNKLLTLNHGIYSSLALLPALLGMLLGQKIRRQLSEALFRRVFFIALLLLGAYLLSSVSVTG